MIKINSVLGPLDTVNLGSTLMHEHLIVAAAGVSQNYPGLLGVDFMERIVDRLLEAKREGVDTIVDATTLDLGRDVTMMIEASRHSGVNIIACSGLWLERPRYLDEVSADQFAHLFIGEINEGIAGTGAKAGILKASSDVDGVTPGDESILRGVARAHLQTDVPIMLHSHPQAEVGRKQLAILKEEAVDLGRVKVDHSNDTTDLAYLIWLLEQGCYLGLDRYPGWNEVNARTRTETMKTLIDAGYGDRLLLSHDHSLVTTIREASAITQEEREAHNPDGLFYIKRMVFPQLQEMGISEKVLNGLLVDNPRNFFEGD
jgi:phosphotriesterase-related protein